MICQRFIGCPLPGPLHRISLLYDIITLKIFIWAMRSLISPCAVIDDTTAVLAAVQALGSSVTRLPASPWPASWPEPWPRVSEPNAVTATTAAAVRTQSRHSRRDRGDQGGFPPQS